MADIKKVIKGLERCSLIDMCYMEISCYHPKYLECPYHEESECVKHLVNDALELLNERKAVEPYQNDAVWLCGNCTKEVVGWTDDITGEDIRYPFCRQCGRPVKWDVSAYVHKH